MTLFLAHIMLYPTRRDAATLIPAATTEGLAALGSKALQAAVSVQQRRVEYNQRKRGITQGAESVRGGCPLQ
jgi:hypothetical protein